MIRPLCPSKIEFIFSKHDNIIKLSLLKNREGVPSNIKFRYNEVACWLPEKGMMIIGPKNTELPYFVYTFNSQFHLYMQDMIHFYMRYDTRNEYETMNEMNEYVEEDEEGVEHSDDDDEEEGDDSDEDEAKTNSDGGVTEEEEEEEEDAGEEGVDEDKDEDDDCWEDLEDEAGEDEDDDVGEEDENEGEGGEDENEGEEGGEDENEDVEDVVGEKHVNMKLKYLLFILIIVLNCLLIFLLA